MEDGSQFRVRGTAQKGGVVITLRQRPHPRFKRAGDHLVMQTELTLQEALLGFQRSIRHLEGSQIWVSAEGQLTKPGQLRRLRGYGMPRLRAGGHPTGIGRARLVMGCA